MGQLKIDESQFSVTVGDKYKLSDIFGEKFVYMLPKVYKELADVLNRDSFFDELIEKRICDKNFQNTALEKLKLHLLIGLYDFDDELITKVCSAKTIKEINDKDVSNKINSILGDSKELAYFDVLFSIVENLFNRYVYYFLRNYIEKQEPALSNCRGVKDAQQCQFIIERYHQFINSLSVDAIPNPPDVDNNGCVIINQGDLFHGTKYSEQVVKSIATRGLESGQLHGIDEDGETFLCIDFFKATKTSTPDEICKSGHQYTNGSRDIIFVINKSNLEGSDAMFPQLTCYDAYNETTEEGQKARDIVNIAGLPLDYSTGAAILMGVPPCMISSIIINSEIEKYSEKIEFLASQFPKATIVSRTNGNIIKQPTKSYKR